MDFFVSGDRIQIFFWMILKAIDKHDQLDNNNP